MLKVKATSVLVIGSSISFKVQEFSQKYSKQGWIQDTDMSLPHSISKMFLQISIASAKSLKSSHHC
jgi:hypothetical protein